MSETTSDSGQPGPEGPVERFNPFIDELDSLVPDPGMIEVTDGGWVRYEDYEKLKRERDELQQWKDSQLSVALDWQEIGREMGLTLGDSVHDKILPWIREMKQEYVRLDAAVTTLWEQMNPEGLK